MHATPRLVLKVETVFHIFGLQTPRHGQLYTQLAKSGVDIGFVTKSMLFHYLKYGMSVFYHNCLQLSCLTTIQM